MGGVKLSTSEIKAMKRAAKQAKKEAEKEILKEEKKMKNGDITITKVNMKACNLKLK